MNSKKTTIKAESIGVPDLARAVGCDTKTARRYVAELFPDHAPGTHYRFPLERLEELKTYCVTKRRRRCLNRLNAALIGATGV